jgi:GNAT superfamily N-acetyltransferase
MDPRSAPARLILRRYFDEVVGRYHGRQATEHEIDSAIRDDPSDDLTPPGGMLLVARERRAALGCAGLRLLSGDEGQVKRLFVVPSARGTGLGERLMHEVEAQARELGVRELRLDTRGDLVEARRLYARIGYEETAPFNDQPYADHSFRKRSPEAQHLAAEGGGERLGGFLVTLGAITVFSPLLITRIPQAVSA